MPAREASDRALIAQIASNTSWAKPQDRSARTAPAREKSLARFENQVDPEGKLDEAERARLATHARKAYFAKLALKSAQARRARRRADELDAEVAEALQDEAVA